VSRLEHIFTVKNLAGSIGLADFRQAFSSGILACTHEVVDPEFDDCEVVAGIAMMDEVQSALCPKPGEALQG
jgi:hypothetical protein